MVKLILIFNGERLPDTTYKSMEDVFSEQGPPKALIKFLPETKEDAEAMKAKDLTIKAVIKRISDGEILLEFAGKYHGTKNPFAVTKALPATAKKKLK